MTTLRLEPYEIPAADLGPENPLPMFRGAEDDARMNLDPSIPEEDRRYLGWRVGWRVLPHRMQDGYNRKKRPQTFDSLVLENGVLRATFLPQFGGRLVSLYHKPAQRELLERNPVFQPANLALRDAWISGGVEWNTAQPGHHYLTCSPLFAASVEGCQGEPVLRLYEWDRVKCFPWQIDFHLPPDSPFLFARMRLLNPHRHELPMYWWTNIAVEERADVRVLVPAETAICHAYQGGLQVVALPVLEGRDLSYSTRSPRAFDFFSRIPSGQRRWVTALDGEGRGLFEASTDRLRGRKLFCWGMRPGGRQWQEFLAQPGHAYIEIQAGLARTQMECIPMPAGATWCWTEAFGLLEADPERVHGEDWTAAWQAAGEAIEQLLPRADLEAQDARFAEVTERPPERELWRGSGWGALERRRWESRGLPDLFPAALPFPSDSLGPEQLPWLALLETGVLPERDPNEEPGALMTQEEWRDWLERSVGTPEGNHWLAWWHLGNLRMEAREDDGAEEAWQTSLQRRPTGWGLRNLAVLANRRKDSDRACDLMRQACEMLPQSAPLALEYAQMLLQAERYAEVCDFVTALPDSVRAHERLLLAWAKAALATGELEGVEHIFEHDFASIREGEVTLTDLWFAWQEKRLSAAEGVPVDEALRERVRREYPPPRNIDFRMAGVPEEG